MTDMPYMTFKSIFTYFTYISILTDMPKFTNGAYPACITLMADVPTLTYLAYMAVIMFNMSTMT
jgi:hypothetical protein